MTEQPVAEQPEQPADVGADQPADVVTVIMANVQSTSAGPSGGTVTLPGDEARDLIRAGLAVPAPPPPPEPAAVTSAGQRPRSMTAFKTSRSGVPELA